MNSDADISSICMNLLAYVSLSSSGHWTFFIIAIKVRRVYILDSPFKEGNKNPSHYRLISVIESALLSIKPTFDMVNCNQQAETWECGYILLQSMFDFVNVYQEQFPKMWNDTKEATDEDIEKMLKEFMPILFDELGIPYLNIVCLWF